MPTSVFEILISTYDQIMPATNLTGNLPLSPLRAYDTKMWKSVLPLENSRWKSMSPNSSNVDHGIAVGQYRPAHKSDRQSGGRRRSPTNMGEFDRAAENAEGEAARSHRSCERTLSVRKTEQRGTRGKAFESRKILRPTLRDAEINRYNGTNRPGLRDAKRGTIRLDTTDGRRRCRGRTHRYPEAYCGQHRPTKEPRLSSSADLSIGHIPGLLSH